LLQIFTADPPLSITY